MRILTLSLLLVLCASFALGETRVLTALPPITMAEAALRPSVIVPHQPRMRTRSFMPPALTAAESVNGVASTAGVTLPAPKMIAGFRAAYDIGAYPSDAAGAVGPHHVLTVCNTNVIVQDRSGNTLTSVTLPQFWSYPNFQPGGAVFDSRALYDPRSDRWFITSLYDVNSHNSTLFFAISDTGDPTGKWERYPFVIDSTDALSADFVRAVLTRDAIVLTTNIYYFVDTAQGSEVIAIPRSDLAAPPNQMTVATLSDGVKFDLAPVAMLDDDPSIYIVWLYQDGATSLMKVNGGHLDSVHAFFTSVPFGEMGVTNTAVAPQAGFTTPRLDVGFPVKRDAVVRNGYLWMVDSGFMPSPTRSSILWWRIRLSDNTLTNGRIDDPSGTTFYAFPSLAVNRLGEALIGYSMFTPDTFPSAGYTLVDSIGDMSAPALLKAGEDAYFNNRWADFSTTVVDPVDDTSFWTIQTYAMQMPGQQARWAVWWGDLAVKPPRARAARH